MKIMHQNIGPIVQLRVWITSNRYVVSRKMNSLVDELWGFHYDLPLVNRFGNVTNSASCATYHAFRLTDPRHEAE